MMARALPSFCHQTLRCSIEPCLKQQFGLANRDSKLLWTRPRNWKAERTKTIVKVDMDYWSALADRYNEECLAG